jgi:hypothetical protein
VVSFFLSTTGYSEESAAILQASFSLLMFNCFQVGHYHSITIITAAAIITTIIINLSAKSALCTAIVLFEFACLIRHNGNTKGKQNHFLLRKSQHNTGH